jgi:lipid-binding SYLF domain-containing protein
VNSLLSSSFKLGGDVSVAAGPVGAGTGAPVTADMVSFVRSKGLYGGINLDGSVISVDDEANKNFFGQAATPVDILAKGTVHSPLAAPLTQAATSTSGAHGK